jgi:diaminopimelate decarboxylase
MIPPHVRVKSQELAKTARTPFYLIDIAQIAVNYREFKEAWSRLFPKLKIAYSYKTNSLGLVTRTLLELGACAEVVSGDELEHALADGFAPEHIFFDGPVKTKYELACALSLNLTVQVDSLDELSLLISLCQEQLTVPKVSCRLTTTYRGRASRFGLTAHEFALAKRMLIDADIPLAGVHTHVGYSTLSSQKHTDCLRDLEPIFREVLNCDESAFIDIGGGYPSRTTCSGREPVSHDLYAEFVAGYFKDIGLNCSSLNLIIEPGRCLVEDEGYLVTQIISVKKREPRDLLVLDAGTNLIRSINSWHHAAEIIHQSSDLENNTTNFDIFGCNCFESDFFFKDFPANSCTSVGDLIVITGVGGYDIPSANVWIRPAPAIYALDNQESTLLVRAPQLTEHMRNMEPEQNQIQLARKIYVSESCELIVLESSNSQVLFNCVDTNRHHLGKWLPWVEFTKCPSNSRNFIEAEQHAHLLAQRASYGIFNEGSLIGMIAFHKINWDCEQASIGYWVSLAHQGKGFITKACISLVNYGFSNLKLNKVIISCAVENDRSRVIAEKLGFRLEGILTANEKINGMFLDHAIYGLTVEKWKNGRGASHPGI